MSETFEVEPQVVLADAGYCNEADLVALEQRDIDGHVALGREGKAQAAVDPKTRPPPIAWARSWPVRRAGRNTPTASKRANEDVLAMWESV